MAPRGPSDLPPPVLQLQAALDWERLACATLVVACSGGPDSVALACAARALLANPGILPGGTVLPELVLWHLDHGLRDDSAVDAAFVESLGRQLGVRVIVEQAQLGERLAAEGGNLEAAARAERYGRLALLIADPESCGLRGPLTAMTAHHLGDQAETVLHHIVRGTHLAGLRGIARHPQPGILRPWLSLAPEEIHAYLQELKQDFVVDATNADTAFTRNFIRQRVMPLLLELNPRAREHLARLAETASTVEGHLREVQGELQVVRAGHGEVCGWLPLLHWPAWEYSLHLFEGGLPAAQTLAAYAAGQLAHEGVTLDYAEHGQVHEWADQPQAALTLRGWTLSAIAEGLVALEQQGPPPAPLSVVLSAQQPSAVCDLVVSLNAATQGGWDLHRRRDRQPWERIESWRETAAHFCLHPPQRETWTCFLGRDVLLPLTLRTWNVGERIELAGGGSKTVGDLFTDCGVPQCFRGAWAVLADANGQVLWVPGLADGAAMRLGDAAPRWVVQLRETAAQP